MDNISLLSSFLKMIFALAIVLGLLVGVTYFVKRFMQQTGPATDNQDLINVVSSKWLGPKSRIILLEVLDQIIVVGISNQQMTPLATIHDQQALEKIRANSADAKKVDFAGSKLAQYMSAFRIPSRPQKDKTGK